MLKRIPSLACLVVALFAVASPASANSKSTPKPALVRNLGYVYKSLALMPGKSYRLRVTSASRVRFRGNAIEDVLYLSKGRLGESSKSLSLAGMTPKSFIIRQPVRGTLRSWVLAMNLYDGKNKPLHVRFQALGKGK